MRISDSLVGAGFLGAGALAIATTVGYPAGHGGGVGPALFPRVTAGIMMVLGALLMIRGLRAKDTSETVDWRGLHRNPLFLNALSVIGAAVAYILLVDRLGFLVMGSVMVFALMWRLRVRPAKSLLVAVVFTTVAYLLFGKILRVPLALGIIWW